jgi:Leucine-rich repeat (LRR) protein/nitrous oxidase accessory protein NosD
MKRFCLPIAAVLVAFGCSEAPTDLPSDLQPQLAVGGAAACPTPADVVVTTDAELRDAVAAASPGDVIGIEGLIEVFENLPIDVEGVALTCASPGSGLIAGVPYLSNYMLWVRAPDVTIDRLTLDATNAIRSSILTQPNPRADGLRVTNNTIYSGPLGIMLLSGTEDAVVADNYAEVTLPTVTTGIHIQRAGGTRVTGNRVVARVPVGNDTWGAIRLFALDNVVLADNHAEGPWSNGYALALLTGSEVSRNRAEGSRNFGFAASLSGGPASMVNNVFRNNQATRVGAAASVPPGGLPTAGLLVSRACGNTFIGNNLQNNYDNVGAIFRDDSGANTLVGDGTIVVDDGDFDCDGDGLPDPNQLTGKGYSPRTGVKGGSGGSFKLCGAPGNDGTAMFEDANLEAAVRVATGAAEGPLACDQVAMLGALFAEGLSISSLEGMQNLTGLTDLSFDTNQITDISPLSGLMSLGYLRLERNSITDLSALSGLTSLESLCLDGNTVDDISALNSLMNLDRLCLGGNTISDVSPLSGLTGLTALDVGGNQVTSVTPLAGLAALTSLSLGDNAISDISALSGLINLEVLYLPFNQIADVSIVSGMTNLWALSLQGNSITDLSPLSGLTGLTDLDLGANGISNVGPLSGLSALRWLHIYGNVLSDIGPLSGLTLLEELNLSGNSPLSNIQPLIDNLQFASGDRVDLNNVNPALVCTDVEVLRDRGVEVTSNLCS